MNNLNQENAVKQNIDTSKCFLIEAKDFDRNKHYFVSSGFYGVAAAFDVEIKEEQCNKSKALDIGWIRVNENLLGCNYKQEILVILKKDV